MKLFRNLLFACCIFAGQFSSAQHFGLDLSYVHAKTFSTRRDTMLFQPMNGIQAGVSFMDRSDTNSTMMYAGMYFNYFFPHGDSISVVGFDYMQPQGQNEINVPAYRKASFYTIAFRMSYPLMHVENWFNLYFGLDMGFMGGIVNCNYNYPAGHPDLLIGYYKSTRDGVYLEQGHNYYSNFLLAPYLGMNFQFENISIFMNAGYRFARLDYFPGDGSGALTLEAGIHIPFGVGVTRVNN